MKEINLNSWSRRPAYELFRRSQQPHFNVTAPVDVTGMMQHIKPTGVSVFNYTLYAIMKAVNDVPELRLRFDGDRVFELDVTHPSYTVPIADNNFAFCQTEFSDDWQRFNNNCAASIEEAKKQTKLKEEADHFKWTYLTCAPWLSFTGMTHPVAGPDDCIPRIAWGKITKSDQGYNMPLNIQMHHALADGFHISQFFQKVEENLATASDL
ncbi:chloramphenicol acetyltransferase [Sneathiella sp. P13V-1]|uniref:chloramphenicol acetyltransferase n=1 Tax=Sneathiella sp. P13V-1 TaxID=2697366 RepID=UPI00187B3530|nr:chloramphenicol acetyltransferase [Sneathiella sp. P13V-1]MBE7636954.1 chloramphenicol acetyltransferase [Sneathiella sp. P13V-1]